MPMKSKQEITKAIAAIKKDPRMEKVVTVDVNAPLALIQWNLEGQEQALRWVLKDD